MIPKTITLNGPWKFKAIDKYNLLPPEHNAVKSWMTGTVPGTVHTDVMKWKKIPDPFYRLNELDVQWIDTQQWIYGKEFIVQKSFLREEKIELIAEGLDTY